MTTSVPRARSRRHRRAGGARRGRGQGPRSFAPGLAHRTAVDQGLVTALATGVHYLLAAGTQDALQAVAAELARTPAAARWGDPATRQRTLALAMDVAAVPVGLALRRLLPSHPGEAMARGWMRQAGWRAATTGFAALSLEATRVGLRALIDDRVGADGRVAGLPVAVPLGLTIVSSSTAPRNAGRRRRRDCGGEPPLARSVLVAAGVEGGLAALAYGEHVLAGADRDPARRPAAGRAAAVATGDARVPTLGVVAVTATERVGPGDAPHRGRGGGRRAGVRWR